MGVRVCPFLRSFLPLPARRRPLEPDRTNGVVGYYVVVKDGAGDIDGFMVRLTGLQRPLPTSIGGRVAALDAPNWPIVGNHDSTMAKFVRGHFMFR